MSVLVQGYCSRVAHLDPPPGKGVALWVNLLYCHHLYLCFLLSRRMKVYAFPFPTDQVHASVYLLLRPTWYKNTMFQAGSAEFSKVHCNMRRTTAHLSRWLDPRLPKHQMPARMWRQQDLHTQLEGMKLVQPLKEIVCRCLKTYK